MTTTTTSTTTPEFIPWELYIRFPSITASEPNTDLSALSNKCFHLWYDNINSAYIRNDILNEFTITQSTIPLTNNNNIFLSRNNTSTVFAVFSSISTSVTGTYFWDNIDSPDIIKDLSSINISASFVKCRPYYFQDLIARRYFTYNNIRHNGTKIENDKLYSILALQNNPHRIQPNFNILPYSIKLSAEMYGGELKILPGGFGGITHITPGSEFIINNECDLKQQYKILYDGIEGSTANFIVQFASKTFTIGTSGNKFVFDIGGSQEYVYNNIFESKSFEYQPSAFFDITWAGDHINIFLDRDPKWSIVETTNKYPDLDLMYGKYLSAFYPQVDQNSRTGVSKPFSMVLQNRYFTTRYWLPHPPTAAKPCQSNSTGRWVYGRTNIFTTYIATVSTIDYDFSYNAVDYNLLSSNCQSIDLNKNDLVVSDVSGNVIYKSLSNIDSYTSNTSIISSNFIDNTNNVLLSAFDGSFNYTTPNISYGHLVKISDLNVAVSEPSSNKIYIHQLNDFNNSITASNIIEITGKNIYGYGQAMDYKSVGKSFELLAVSVQNDANTSIDVFENNVIRLISGTPVSAHYSIDKNFINSFSVKSITAEPIMTGSFGYDVQIQIKDYYYNKQTEFIYISEPFRDNGYVHVYLRNKKSSQWEYVSSLSSVAGNNYGFKIYNSGAYTCVLAPSTIVNSILGSQIDLYKTSSTWLTATSSVSATIALTDTIFISGDYSKGIALKTNYFTTMPADRKYNNFYGDHFAISDGNDTKLYSIHFDKLEPINNINGYDEIKMHNNLLLGVNNNNTNVNINVARSLNI